MLIRGQQRQPAQIQAQESKMSEAWLSVISLVGLAVITFIGYAFNQLITKKIDDLTQADKDTRRLFFDKIDTINMTLSEVHDRVLIVEQNHKYLKESSDEKFKNVIEAINTRIGFLEEKMGTKIDDLKKLIGDKFIIDK